MKTKDDRYYTFVVSRSNRNNLKVRRVTVCKRRLHSIAAAVMMAFAATSYGFYVLAGQIDNFSLAAQNNQEIRQSFQNSQSIEQPTGEGGPDETLAENVEQEEAENTALYEKIRGLEESLGSRVDVPSIYPLVGKINNEFGWRSNPFGGRSIENHSGMDIDGERGAPVIAPADGVCVQAGWKGGYGNFIEISHGNGLTTRYGHLSQIEIEAGDAIARGQQIGRVGSTGRSTGPHLHYEVRIDNKAVDPRGYLPPNPVEAE